MGGDQLIQGTYLIAGGYERRALIFEPTYPMFSHAAKFNQTIAKNFDIIQPHLKNIAEAIILERERVASQFKEMGISFIPSQGNFLLFKVKNPSFIFQQLSESGVRIRSLHTIPGLADYLRVKIGKKEENDLFLENLSALLTK